IIVAGLRTRYRRNRNRGYDDGFRWVLPTNKFRLVFLNCDYNVGFPKQPAFFVVADGYRRVGPAGEQIMHDDRRLCIRTHDKWKSLGEKAIIRNDHVADRRTVPRDE